MKLNANYVDDERGDDMTELEIFDYSDNFQNDDIIEIGTTFLEDEHLKDFDDYAKEILKRAGWKAEASADNGESKSHEVSGRNNHNVIDDEER